MNNKTWWKLILLSTQNGWRKSFVKEIKCFFFWNYCITELVAQSVRQSDSQYQMVCQAFLPVTDLPLIWRQGFKITNDENDLICKYLAPIQFIGTM